MEALLLLLLCMSSSLLLGVAAFLLGREDTHLPDNLQAGPMPPGTRLGAHYMTWYTFQGNTPCNTTETGSGRPLQPYVSAAVPFTMLRERSPSGKLRYGDHLYVRFLDGRAMPNGKHHTGWVRIDDFCGDQGDDEYCYKTVAGTRYPSVDLYIGDWTKSGMSCGKGPAGSGMEKTEVVVGPAPQGKLVTDYGGAAVGKGKRCDCAAARAEQKCWYYTPPYESWWKDVC